MKLDKIVNEVITAAYNEAKYLRHEYLTPEHILYAALFFKEGVNIIEGTGGDVDALKEDLVNYLNENINIIEEGEPLESIGLQNILSSAGEHVLTADKEIVKLGDIFIAIYDEPESFAGYYLKKQGIQRLDVLNYITHGISESNFEIPYEESEIDEENFYEESSNNRIKISDFAIELTEQAKEGLIDDLIGREDILDRTIQVLARRQKNNPIHVGDTGVGKTAITKGLAKLISENKVPKILQNSKIFSLDLGSMLAGTKYRGDFEERIKKVLKNIEKEERPIVYIDEIHTIIGAGAVSGGSLDASNILKPFLSEGKIRFIGATTYDEYKKIFEKDKALSRRFQKIEVMEPTTEDTYKILEGIKTNFQDFHGVVYTNEALRAAVELSAKYINDRHLPDKAIDVIDEAGAYARLHAEENEIVNISVEDIEMVVSSMAKIPEQNVSANELDLIKKLEENLKSTIYGQDKAIETIVNAIKRSRAGFNDENRPVANLLFVGPTGVGKTELCKQLSKQLNIPLIRFDMSEYQEKHTVARLIGAPPGYVGYEEGGLLTDSIRKTPYCVLLLDEIEKVHQDVLNVLLQLMDYATVTDSNGRKADFRNVILIMTSNAGASSIGKAIVGFGGKRLNYGAIDNEVKRVFSPEFRNRLDEIVVFNGMDENMALLVAKKAIKQFEEKLRIKNISICVTEDCYNWLAKKGLNSEYGAREINRVVQQEIKPYFVDKVLFEEISKEDKIVVDVKDNSLIIYNK